MGYCPKCLREIEYVSVLSDIYYCPDCGDIIEPMFDHEFNTDEDEEDN